MKFKSSNELRSSFLNFFKNKGHLVLKSFPLVPINDNSLLLINSGMAPMKDWFLKKTTPPSTKVTTCQKCVRTLDINQVGLTDRHGTFFEMLGNFSFGDYFKKEAIALASEYIFNELEIPEDRIFITVYEDDDESAEIWQNQTNVAPSKISKLGKEDNFWEIGNGPCGPCSEIYYDRGEQFGCGSPNCAPGCDCARFIEIWNLVFTQFNRNEAGEYSKLSSPNIDTGMGLERLALVVQEVNNVFEIDSTKQILLKINENSKITYGENSKADVNFRILADHIRSSVFLIADGVVPSNESRGYVLRKLIRRSLNSAIHLNLPHNFLSNLAETAVSVFHPAYPELKQNLSFIQNILNNESEGYFKTITKGKQLFSFELEKLKKNNKTELSAETAFNLCDTHGVPFNLLQTLASEHNLTVDEEGFLKLMQQQKQRAREALNSANVGWKELKLNLTSTPTIFVGYHTLKAESTMEHIFIEETEQDQASLNQKVTVIVNETPFYAQGGGQVGDCGEILSETGLAEVVNCFKLASGHYAHQVIISNGELKKKQKVTLKVDSKKRSSASKNHTAAHILHQALINTLGNHVRQAGQLINPAQIRFDFSHNKSLTEDELKKIEEEVNSVILNNLPVVTETMNKEEAEKLGAIALFKEKYASLVRVVKIGEFSLEFCGGTHVKNSGEIGLFKIISETSIGSNVRRIEAVTGLNSLNYFNELTRSVNESCFLLNSNHFYDIPKKIKELQLNEKQLTTQLNEMMFKQAAFEFEQNFNKCAHKIDGLDVVAHKTQVAPSINFLRNLGISLKNEHQNLVALLTAKINNKFTILIVCSDAAIQKDVTANSIVAAITKLINSSGGGKKDLATTGTTNPENVNLVINNFTSIIQNML